MSRRPLKVKITVSRDRKTMMVEIPEGQTANIRIVFEGVTERSDQIKGATGTVTITYQHQITTVQVFVKEAVGIDVVSWPKKARKDRTPMDDVPI